MTGALLSITINDTYPTAGVGVMSGTQSVTPSVTIEVENWKWKYADAELAIDEPNTTPGLQPVTIAGGFKMTTIQVSGTGYLDVRNGTVLTQIHDLLNIAEYANPALTYATYRGVALFGVTSPTEGIIKITQMEIDEDALISEPAVVVSGKYNPIRAKVTFTLRFMKRSS